MDLPTLWAYAYPVLLVALGGAFASFVAYGKKPRDSKKDPYDKFATVKSMGVAIVAGFLAGGLVYFTEMDINTAFMIVCGALGLHLENLYGTLQTAKSSMS